MPIAGGPSLKRLPKDERGSAVVEFAMIMVPLFALILASLQTAIIFFEGQQIQTAAEEAGRQLLTGAAQNAGLTQQQFLTQDVCPNAKSFNCNNLMVDVESSSDFSSTNTATVPLTYDKNGNVTNGAKLNYSPGSAGDIVIVRVMYEWPVFGGKLGFGLSNQPGNQYLLVGTTVFKNEPYQ